MLRTWARVCTVNSCCALGHIPAKLKVLGKPAASGAELIRRVFPFPSCSWAGRAHKAIWCFALWIGVSYIWIWGLEVDPEEKVGKLFVRSFLFPAMGGECFDWPSQDICQGYGWMSKRRFPELSEGTELSFATPLPQKMAENRIFCAEY